MTLPAAKPIEPCRYTIEEIRRREAGETSTDRILNAIARAAERHEQETRRRPWNQITPAERQCAADEYRALATELERA
jgi:hypothetical protein